MANRYLLESGTPDGYLLEDGSGVLLLQVSTENPFGQAQAKISALNTNNYGQAQADIKQTYTQSGQTQSKINAFNVNQFGQSNVDIKQTYVVSGQANTHIKILGRRVGQSAAIIYTGITTVLDTFTRTITDGLGTADVGGDWSYLFGAASQWDVDGSKLVFTSSTSGVSTYYALNSVNTGLVSEAYLDFTIVTLGATGTHGIEVDTSYSNFNSTRSGAQVTILASTGAINLFSKTINNFSSVSLGSILVGQTWRLKTQVKQIHAIDWVVVRSKAWNLSGTEPGWQTTATTDNLGGLYNASSPSILIQPGNTSFVLNIDNFNKQDISWSETGQAQAFIKDYPHGQAMAIINTGITTVVDTFTRSVSDGLGTADIGGDWTYISGIASQWDVNGSQATFNSITSFSDNIYSLKSVYTGLVSEVYVDINFISLGTSQAHYIIVATSFTDINHYNATYISIYPNATSSTPVFITNVAGSQFSSQISLGSYPLIGATWRLKIQVKQIHADGFINIRSKAWDLSGTEPGWQSVSTGTVSQLNFFNPASPTLWVESGNTSLILNIDNFNKQDISWSETGQAQAKINAFDVNNLGQAQAVIKQAYTAFVQSQADIKQIYFGLAQAQADIKQTYFAFGQAQADIKQIGYGLGQAQANIKQIYFGLGQSQSKIKQIYTSSGQSQADIKNTYVVLGQANADIQAVGFVLGQANADIKQVYFGLGQSNADIKTTLNSFGQAQSDIKQIYSASGQSNADIKSTSIVSGQSQADIKQTYVLSGQTQSNIKVIDRGLGQAQSSIKQTYPLCVGSDLILGDLMLGDLVLGESGLGSADICIGPFAQAQARILGFPTVSGQAQSDIKQTYFGLGQALVDIKQIYTDKTGQAQARLIAFDVIRSGQAQGNVRAEGNFTHGQTQARVYAFDYPRHGQVNAYIILVNQNVFAQAQADILHTYFALGQSQALIRRTEFAFGQSQADIKQAYTQSGQAQANIRNIYVAHGQTQASIRAIYNGSGQAQTYVKGLGTSVGQAQGSIKQIYIVFGQTNAQITGSVQDFGQAQADIKSISRGFGQANADIKQTYVSVGQAQALITKIGIACAQAQGTVKSTYTQSGQANADIKQTFRSFAQAQAQIKTTITVSGQAQAYIILLQKGYGQAQASIILLQSSSAQAQGWVLQTSTVSANAQATIRITINSYAQALAAITTIHAAYGQANSSINSIIYVNAQVQALIILLGRKSYAQAQAWIIKSAGYGQAQGFIRTTHSLSNVLISDERAFIVFGEDEVEDTLSVDDDNEVLNIILEDTGITVLGNDDILITLVVDDEAFI